MKIQGFFSIRIFLLSQFFLISLNLVSQEIDCASLKQLYIQQINSYSEKQQDYYNKCPKECECLKSFLNEVSNLIKSFNCQGGNGDYYINQAKNLVAKYEGPLNKCNECFLDDGNKKEENNGRTDRTEQQNQTGSSNKITPVRRDPGIEAAERAAQMTNAVAGFANMMESNSQDRQNKLNDINSRDLTNKIELQPKISEEYYNSDKKNIEGAIYGEVNTSKFGNSFGTDSDNSLDDILGESKNNDVDSNPKGIANQNNLGKSNSNEIKPWFPEDNAKIQIDKYSNTNNLLDYYTKNTKEISKETKTVDIGETTKSFCENIGFSAKTCKTVDEFGNDLGGSIKKAGSEALEQFPSIKSDIETLDLKSKISDGISKVTTIPSRTLDFAERFPTAVSNLGSNAGNAISKVVENYDFNNTDKVIKDLGDDTNKAVKQFYKDMLF